MDLSKIKMVVSDMDGTLLNSKHEVSNRFFEIHKELKQRNIQFVAASGRQYHSMVDKLEAIQDDVIFVAENGAFVKRKEEVLLTTPIDKKHVNSILSLIARTTNVHPVLCSKESAYVRGNSGKFLEMLKEYYTEFEIVEDQTKVKDEILKVAIYHFESSEEHIYPVVKHLEDTLKVKVSGSNWVDVSHKNAHKGYALEKLMRTYKINSDEIMVFGDYNNDLEMLQLSNFSFAMANAHPNIQRVAKYNTLSNNEHGVEHILEKML
ncbi:Cof-type HAD-IIB family hydrolase [Flagellimonas aquimarina]|jgi:Cof subfamily protein (haloacid dehalogenase superfamily)|uniref:Cof-type HAD-IIB family hydrolase n=1 Tax=Flagellimonas aquimarina TaxID=2201895 RepID=A0A316LBC7_9FLAO|nr:HAD family hydrolase [Allomuricauda koreensis]PWL37390.1 Cof-type HAD-IIB family hydrolase [Allomuricauda koreensis]